jgi:Ca2+-binding EF-hand superfamily protein
MIQLRLFPLFCSATLFLTGSAWAETATVNSDSTMSAPSAIGQDIFGPALAPPQHHDRPLTPQEQELLAKFDKNGDGQLDAAELDAAHGAAQQQKQGREVQSRQMYDAMLAKFDTAHEGKLNADEQQQALAFLKTERPRAYQAFVKQFDRNGDGELNAAEAGQMFQYLSYLPSGLGKLAAKPAVAVTATAAPAPGEESMNGGDTMSMNSMAGAATAAAMPADAPAAQPKAGNPANRVAQIRRMYAKLLKGFDHENKGSLTPAEQSEALDYIEQNNPEVFQRFLARFDQDGDGKLDANETAALFAMLAKVAGQQQAASLSK